MKISSQTNKHGSTVGSLSLGRKFLGCVPEEMIPLEYDSSLEIILVRTDKLFCIQRRDIAMMAILAILIFKIFWGAYPPNRLRYLRT